MSGKSNNKKLKNVQKNKEEPIPIFNNKFSVESEIISNYLVEKLISLSISESLKNTVNKLFEKGDMKFIWVRQNYSGIFNYSMSIKKTLKEYNLNLSKFYGK